MKIVAVLLIKNEDLYIKKIIENIIDFSDEILVLENYSTDKTYEIVTDLAKVESKIKVIRITDAFDTHRYIEPYVGTNTWIFRVDGDEIYDKEGLVKFKKTLMTGCYDGWWNVGSNSINIENINISEGTGTGYLGMMTALANMSVLKEWHEGRSERLIGTNRVYIDSFDKNKFKLNTYPVESFDQSCFRCLHLCFVKRSTVDKETLQGRLNPVELSKWYRSFLPIVHIVKNAFKGDFSFASNYKIATYKKGKKTTIDISDFLK
ncbi:MAG: glycosyltransferase [bacterium]